MDLEKNESLLSKSSLKSLCSCCPLSIKSIKSCLSSERVVSLVQYFFHLLGAADLLSDILVTLVYYQKDYFNFWICSLIFLTLPALVTAIIFIISFNENEGYFSLQNLCSILIGWIFFLIFPVLIILRPLFSSEEMPFESHFSQNFKFFSCFLESIPQFVINILFLYHEKSLNLINMISLVCSGCMILYGIIRGIIEWENFNFRSLAFDLDYENDGS
jgi:hypothetical protein